MVRVPLLTLLTPGVSYGRVTFVGRDSLDGGLTSRSGCPSGPQVPRPSGTRTQAEVARQRLLSLPDCVGLLRPRSLRGSPRWGQVRTQRAEARRPLKRSSEAVYVVDRSLQTAETCGRDAGACKPASSVATTLSPMGPAVRVSSRAPSFLVGSPCVLLVAVAVAVAAAGPARLVPIHVLSALAPPVRVRTYMIAIRGCQTARGPCMKGTWKSTSSP